MTQASKLLWGYLQVHLVPLGLQVASAALAEQHHDHDMMTVQPSRVKFRVSDRDHALTVDSDSTDCTNLFPWHWQVTVDPV